MHCVGKPILQICNSQSRVEVQIMPFWKYGSLIMCRSEDVAKIQSSHWNINSTIYYTQSRLLRRAWWGLRKSCLYFMQLRAFSVPICRSSGNLYISLGMKGKARSSGLAPEEKFVLLIDTRCDFRAVMEGDRYLDNWNNVIWYSVGLPQYIEIYIYIYWNIIQIYSGITCGRVLNGELYTCKLCKLINLCWSTGCFVKSHFTRGL